MFRTARHPISTFALLLLLAPSITGCMTTRQAPFKNGPVGLERITGVTTRSGREIPFRLPGASIVNDTMYAVGSKGEVSLPSDSIARVWSRKTSATRTAGLIAALAIIGIVVAGATAFGNGFHLTDSSCC
ncbi:MAG TPA: hypothetical protein VLI43_01940 [Gemmatimonadaceae bacterium]|nr:hypothetical protein [Gemmatimonadaceae bacterium]